MSSARCRKTCTRAAAVVARWTPLASATMSASVERPVALVVGGADGIGSALCRQALGRIGGSDEVASLIEYLLDPSHRWLTGQVFGVDGRLGTLRPC